MSEPSTAVRCDYCGLPLAGRTRKDSESVAKYCCYGCRFAAALSREKGEEGQTRLVMIRLGLAVFFSMNVMLFAMALWSADVYHGELSPSEPLTALLHSLYRYLGLIFSLPVLFLLGLPLAESTLTDLRQRHVTADPLLLVGVAAAFMYSAVSTFRGAGHVYFEVVCMVLLAVTFGRWLEATGKLKTTAGLRSLESLLPNQVRRVVDGCATTAAASEVVPGDILRILPGERIAVDGTIVRNLAAIDEQVVTGESQPAIKETGDRVFAGTLNLDGDLLIRSDAPAGRGALERLVASIVEAASKKDRYGRLADRVAAIFLPLVLLLALGTFALHASLAGPQQGLMAALAVLLIACPCALGLATPMAIWAAIGRASRAGVVFRDGDVLDRLAAAKCVFFDKTGTLTTGTSEIQELLADPQTPRVEVLSTSAALAACSSHPFSLAILRFSGNVTASNAVFQPRSIAGRGVTARLDEQSEPAYLGNPKMMEENGLSASARLRESIDRACDEGRPLVCVGWQGIIRGVFVASEELRPRVGAVLHWLRNRAMHVAVLTGDHRQRGERLARQLGISVLADLLPEAKLAALRDARRTHGPVVMVGDGVNDAPALAGADVGVALGCGADVSRHWADVCLLTNDLALLPFGIQLAQQAVRTIRWNLVWAFTYNTIGIALAISGWLNPIVAALAMTASSLMVVTGSLRLANYNPADAALPTANLPLAESQHTEGHAPRNVSGPLLQSDRRNG